MISDEKRSEFAELCKSVSAGELVGEGIGTYGEKLMHKTLKYFLCPDESCHEVRIDKSGIALTERSVDSKAESGRGGFIADIFNDGEIIEIQTGSFYPMKKKIEFYLDKTDYRITVVHPLAAKKWVSWIDTESGDVSKRRASPKRCVASDALPELFWLSNCLSNHRLSFKLLFLEAEEYRLLDGWGNGGKRGSNRYKLVPIDLLDELSYNAPDFAKFLVPQGIGEKFTSKDFASHTKLKGRNLSYSLKLLCECGAIERGEKIGRSYVYRVKK